MRTMRACLSPLMTLPPVLGRRSSRCPLLQGSEQEAADRCVRQASAYLGLYGTATVARSIASTADPAELVIAEVKSLGADLLVMGAYGHRGWREILLGSFTTRLLSECPTALFIHH